MSEETKPEERTQEELNKMIFNDLEQLYNEIRKLGSKIRSLEKTRVKNSI